jgi:hypothetical protein
MLKRPDGELLITDPTKPPEGVGNEIEPLT